MLEQAALDYEFPIRKNRIYLNNAAIGPIPTRARLAAQSYYEDQNDSANAGYPRWTELLERARSRFASLVNTDPETIACIQNTTRGIQIIANGLDWQPGDTVLIPEYEFPANIYPWKNLEALGVSVKFIPEKDGRFEFEDITALVDDRTRLISVSFVEYSTGFRHDLDRLGAFCRKNDIFFCVDAIQGIGVIPLDLQKTHIDAFALDGHKWLLGPCGAGFLYCNPRSLDNIRFGFRGWMSVEHPSDFDNTDQLLSPGARRFEEGTANYPGFIALEQSLSLFEEIGIERIQVQILALTERLMKRLEQKGYTIVSSRRPEERSGIVAVSSPKYDPKELCGKLYDQNIIPSCRRNFLRFSPHFFNTAEEIDTVCDLLPDH